MEQLRQKSNLSLISELTLEHLKKSPDWEKTYALGPELTVILPDLYLRDDKIGRARLYGADRAVYITPEKWKPLIFMSRRIDYCPKTEVIVSCEDYVLPLKKDRSLPRFGMKEKNGVAYRNLEHIPFDYIMNTLLEMGFTHVHYIYERRAFLMGYMKKDYDYMVCGVRR